MRGVVAAIPGQTCVADFPYEGVLSQTMDIIEANYDFNPKNNFNNAVLTVKVSERIADITDVLKDLLISVKRLQAASVDNTTLMSRLLNGVGSVGLQIPLYYIRTRTIGHSLIMDHPINGIMGSPVLGIDGQQVLMGDYRSVLTIQLSGVS